MIDGSICLAPLCVSALHVGENRRLARGTVRRVTDQESHLARYSVSIRRLSSSVGRSNFIQGMCGCAAASLLICRQLIT